MGIADALHLLLFKYPSSCKCDKVIIQSTKLP